MSRAELRRDGEVLLCDVRELEEDVRQARAFGDEQLRYAPWTDDHFERLDRIAELGAAFDTPAARLAASLRAKATPWLTIASVLGVAAFGGVQVAGMVAAGLGGFDVGALLLWGATGWEPMLVDGRWWTPWTSQLLHAGALHLVLNLPLLGYCGMRVERALGVGGTAMVVAAAVLGGTALVTAFGALPVVGASIVAYGLWGAQIAVGLRFGDAVPPGARGFYGWGNLVLFVPLFVSGLGEEGVSHLGHIGGLVGGVLVASLCRPETIVPRREAARRRRRNLATAALLAASPMVAAAVLARTPDLLLAPSERVVEDGLTLTVPWRMATNRVAVAGMPGWVISGNGEEPVWAARLRLSDLADPSPDALADTLERAFVRTPHLVGEPVTEDGWTTWTWALGEGRIVERTRREGWRLVRVGYRVDAADSPREAVYKRIVEGVEVGEPDRVAAARKAHADRPSVPDYAFQLGAELALSGRWSEADGAWAALDTRTDGWEWDAARARLRIGCQDPTLAQDEAWVRGWLARAPEADTELRDAAACWLEARGR